MEIIKPYYDKQIFVCGHEKVAPEKGCGNNDSTEIHRLLKEYVKAHGLKGRIRISRSQCQDLCSEGPIVSVYPENIVYKKVRVGDVAEIIEKHIEEMN
jgi:NADP-reducing hydrogenase subunit HndC